MAIKSPIKGNQAKNAAIALYFSIFSLNVSIFSFFTLKNFIIPPLLLPIAAINTHNQILFPKAIAPTSNASDENGIIVEANKLPINKPQSPQVSNS